MRYSRASAWAGFLSVPALVAGLVRAEERPQPPPAEQPPWQRSLQGEDARKAADQEEQLNRLQEAGKLEEALKAAEAVAQLRERVQGGGHWQAIDARFEVQALRRVLRQDKQAQADYAGLRPVDRQAGALYSKGRFREAQTLFEKVLAIRRKVLGEEHPDTAGSYTNLGISLDLQGKYAEEEQEHRRALAIYRKVLGEEHPDTATSYNNLATSQEHQGKYAQAEEGYRKALAIRRKVLGEEHPDTATGYSLLAGNFNAQGKYALAEEGFRRALAICHKGLGEEHPSTAASYNNLATSQQAQGKYAAAEECHRRALAIFRKLLGEEHPSTAMSYSNLAANQQAQGKYAAAAEGYRRALAIFRKLLGEEHPDTAACYHNVAHNLNAQGKYAAAEECHRRALAIYRKLLGEEHPDTATSYNTLATNLETQGKYAAAEEGHRKALAIRRKVLGDEHPGTATSYSNLASDQQDQGKYAQAEEGYRKALAIRRKVLGEEHPVTATSYSNLAHSFSSQGKYAEAEAMWRRAARSFARARPRIAVSGLDRAAITGEKSPLPSLAAVLARNGKPEEAWQRFEESLARGTWDDLSARLRHSPAEQATLAKLSNRLDRLDQLIEKVISSKEDDPEHHQRRDDLLTERRKVQNELDSSTRQLETKYGPVAGQVFERRHIQKTLPADAALLGWLDLPGDPHAADPNGEHWAILLCPAGQPVWLRLPGSGDRGAWTGADTQLPARLRDALHHPAGDWLPLAQRLRRQRLQPLAGHLNRVRRLIVLPSTALAGVPVEVLADSFTVSYAPSGTLHAHLRRHPAASGEGLLALADPVFDAPAVRDGSPGAWQRLPGTRAEVAALRRLFAAQGPTRMLLDSDAGEQQLHELAESGVLGQYRYLHLATHGEVDNRVPLRSAVILASDRLPDPQKQLEAGLPVYDGRLSAEEVLRQWHLGCELVTLSACQTALGKYERGEGFVGFAQALILAGSRSVCLSLWKVDDTATALLMQRFYQNLLGKREGLKAPLGRAKALAEAKQWLRGLSREEAMECAADLSKGVDRGKGRKVQPLLVQTSGNDKGGGKERPFDHPYYWAAFVLIGQGE